MDPFEIDRSWLYSNLRVDHVKPEKTAVPYARRFFRSKNK